MKKIIFIFIIIGLFCGCSTENEKKSRNKLIAAVGSSKITLEDFEVAFEVTKLGYSHNYVLKNLASLKEDVLTQLIEEELIVEYASKKGIIYTREEFAKDLENVKNEYPDNVFEELLKENAIEPAVFEKRFKREMAVKKALSAIINVNVEVAEEDLRDAFLKYCEINKLNPDDVRDDTDITEAVLMSVKRKKIQSDYDSLLDELKKTTQIDIDRENWAEVLKEGKL
ncbi:MAG: SurA N-terminal domain-containing protein [Desulfobacteraceae bacterium]|nr:SurA N-terminal domain-containing protein [Desulfobacteraceae bacterium]